MFFRHDAKESFAHHVYNPLQNGAECEKMPVLIITDSMSQAPSSRAIEWILRVAVAGEFIGHGVFSLQHKAGWFEYYASVGIGEPTAATLMTLVGLLDLLVAIVVLVHPVRLFLLWAVFWAFLTALIRPIAGEPFWDFVERFANIGAPLALLYLVGLPKTVKEWFV